MDFSDLLHDHFTKSLENNMQVTFVVFEEAETRCEIVQDEAPIEEEVVEIAPCKFGSIAPE